MKKIVSVLLVMLIIMSTFTVSAFAAEPVKKKGFSMNIPEGFTEDKQWAKEKGLAGYWYNEELGIEMLLCVGLTYGFWIDDTYKDIDVSKRVPYQKMYENIRFSNKDEPLMLINDNTVIPSCDFFYVRGEDGTVTEDGAYFADIEYQFPITTNQYSLLFFVDNFEDDREYIEKEIIPSCDYSALPSIYFTAFEPIVLKIIIAAAGICAVIVIITVIKKTKEKRKGE